MSSWLDVEVSAFKSIPKLAVHVPIAVGLTGVAYYHFFYPRSLESGVYFTKKQEVKETEISPLKKWGNQCMLLATFTSVNIGYYYPQYHIMNLDRIFRSLVGEYVSPIHKPWSRLDVISAVACAVFTLGYYRCYVSTRKPATSEEPTSPTTTSTV